MIHEDQHNSSLSTHIRCLDPITKSATHLMAARYWLARTLVCGSALITAGIGKLDPTSQHYESLISDGMNGNAASSCLTVLGLLGLLDVLTNRTKVRLEPLWKFRFLIYLGIAFAQGALAFANTRWGQVEPVIARYTFDFIAAVTIAVLDLRARR